MLRSIIQDFFPAVRNDVGSVSVRLTIHHSIYFILLVLLAGSQSLSNWMMSGMEILLAVNWALECDFRRKYQTARHSPLLAAFLVLAMVHVIWLIPSHNTSYGLYDIFCKLPLIAIPLILLSSRPLNKKQLSFLAFFYVGAVFVVTIIGRVRYATMPDLPYREIIPYISHIRFALNVCLSIILLLWFCHANLGSHRKDKRWKTLTIVSVSLAAAASLVQFLFIIQSYTGLVILILTTIIVLIVFRPKGRLLNKTRNNKYSEEKSIEYKNKIANEEPGINKTIRAFLFSFAALILVFTALVGKYIFDYYRPVPLMKQPLAEFTANGNPYQHKQDGLIENGNAVNNYISCKELEKEWVKRSNVPMYSVTENSYTVYPTLLRYLNALGTTKDSIGMQLLSDKDIALIEKGVANPVYSDGSKLRQMVYVMLYEYESSRSLGVVCNFTMLQRIELWRNAWRVFLKHPVFGTGTGDVADECKAQLAADHSPMASQRPRNIHNQYLALLVTFGLVGFLIVFAAFIWAIHKERLYKSPIVVAYLCIVLISFITENTLSTLAGCVFSSLFLCICSSNREVMNDQIQTKP
ncbi:MAG: O-antigen ligase family protein [Bacteroidales bacterium]|nr:O-antigen ligase family protein [Bacteroidales bacterium]